MKALITTLTFTLTLAVLAGCSPGQYASSQEYDDMYFTSTDRQLVNERARQRETERLRAQQERAAERNNQYDQRDAGSARQLNPDAVDDGYYSDEYAGEDYYVEDNYNTDGSQAPVVNNYYGSNFHDPWMMNPYAMGMGGMGWGMNPWGMGGMGMMGMPMRSGFNMSFGMGMGWGMGMGMGRGFGMGFYDPFWDPYWGSPWGFNSWGMHNPYAMGYRTGFYDGYYRSPMWGSYYNPNGVIVLNDTRQNNIRYSPRAVRGSERLGVGERVSTERMNAPRSGVRAAEGRMIRTGTQSPNSRQAAPAQRRTRSRDGQLAPQQRQQQQQRGRQIEQRRTRDRQVAPQQRQQRQQRQYNPTQRQRSTPTYQRSSPSPRQSTPMQRSTPTRSRTRGGGGMQSSNVTVPANGTATAATVERSSRSRKISSAPAVRQSRSGQPAMQQRNARTSRSGNSFSNSSRQSSQRSSFGQSNYGQRSSGSNASFHRSSPTRSSSSMSSSSPSRSSSVSSGTRSSSRSRGGN